MSLINVLNSLNPTALTLALSILLISDLTVRVITSPNASPTVPTQKDRAGRLLGPVVIFIRQALLRSLGIYHALICLTYPTPPSAICPAAGNVSSYLFTWSTYTGVCIAVIAIAAPIRLLCFAQLGPNFTFRLNAPKKLITTALYAWVQHPSYTTNVAVKIANVALFMRKDGVAACWLPKAVVDGERFGMVFRILPWVASAVLFYILSIRVRDEEEMLRRTFGKEWEIYHRKTKRFFPGIF